MSILLAAETELMPAGVIALWLVGTLVTLGLMYAIGTFKRRSDVALHRVFHGQPVLPLLWNVLAAIAVFISAQSVFIVILLQMYGQIDLQNLEGSLTGGMLVAMSVVTSAVALFSLLGGLAMMRDGFDKVGLRHAPAIGFARGLLMILATLPLLLLVMGSTEWIYKWVGYKHEDAHELLNAMKPDKPLVRFGAIFAAVVLAPMWEELFFRGHLQSLLRRLFTRRLLPVAAPVAPPPVPVGAGVDGMTLPEPPPLATPITTMPLEYVIPGGQYTVPKPSFLPSLLAVLITSGCFAMVHPAWSRPPIFVLALALGFAYERWGNLWVPIAMHACFNGLMTWLYLSQMG